MPEKRRHEYRYSRCYTRLALAQLFDMDPLSIPLFSEPGKPPSLYKGFGYVSICHCRDALLVGWSNSRIGVDIESTKRSINIDRLSNCLLSNDEKLLIKNSNKQSKKKEFLSIWFRKEALIKYSEGNLFRDFKSWKLNQKLSNANNINSSQCPSIKYINYKTWLIGVASDSTSNNSLEIKNIL